jgi:hypothetical protein
VQGLLTHRTVVHAARQGFDEISRFFTAGSESHLRVCTRCRAGGSRGSFASPWRADPAPGPGDGPMGMSPGSGLSHFSRRSPYSPVVGRRSVFWASHRFAWSANVTRPDLKSMAVPATFFDSSLAPTSIAFWRVGGYATLRGR